MSTCLSSGPYPSSSIQAWAAQGYFTDATPVRQCGAAQFVPLKASRLAPRPARPELFWYLDERGNEQGPFRAEHMRNWLVRGLLPPFIKVRSSVDMDAAARRGAPVHSVPMVAIHQKPDFSFVPPGFRFSLPPPPPPQAAPLIPAPTAVTAPVAALQPYQPSVMAMGVEKSSQNAGAFPRPGNEPRWFYLDKESKLLNLGSSLIWCYFRCIDVTFARLLRV